MLVFSGYYSIVIISCVALKGGAGNVGFDGFKLFIMLCFDSTHLEFVCPRQLFYLVHEIHIVKNGVLRFVISKIMGQAVLFQRLQV
jgi:hypothetical protein